MAKRTLRKAVKVKSLGYIADRNDGMGYRRNYSKYSLGGINEELFEFTKYPDGTYRCLGTESGAETIVSSSQFIKQTDGDIIISKRYKGAPKAEGILIRTSRGIAKILEVIVKENGIFYKLATSAQDIFYELHDNLEKYSMIEIDKKELGWKPIKVKGISDAKIFFIKGNDLAVLAKKEEKRKRDVFKFKMDEHYDNENEEVDFDEDYNEDEY